MNLLVILIIGGLVGWIAAQAAGRNTGIIASIVIGIIGSLIGSVLSVVLTGSDRAYLDLSWQGIIWSFIGAFVLVLIVNAVQGRSHSHI